MNESAFLNILSKLDIMDFLNISILISDNGVLFKPAIFWLLVKLNFLFKLIKNFN